MGSTTTCSRAVTAVAAVTFMCLALAVPAQADDESYLERLRQSQSAIPLPDGALVQGGHIICSHLRRGVEPTAESARYFPTDGMPQMISAAQSELCPDTLG